jgi:putative chitinase
MVNDKIVTNFINRIQQYEGITKEGLAMITAQCDHESATFTIMTENLNYSAKRLLEVFPKYFNADNVKEYANQPVKIGNRIYANRMGNGDEQSGDGYKYRGMGYIQLTGKDNYKLYGDLLDIDLVHSTVLLLIPSVAVKVAYEFFVQNNILNCTDIVLVTKKINGGTNGLENRKKLYDYYLNRFVNNSN